MQPPGGLADTQNMQIHLCTPAVLLALVVTAAPAQAQFNVQAPPPPGEDYNVEVGAMFWKPTPELTIRSNDLGLIGNEFDFVQEFGIEEKRFREFRVTLKPGRKHKIRFHYV